MDGSPLLPVPSLHVSDGSSTILANPKYRSDIDGLRAVAALLVVGNHTGVLDGGWPGGCFLCDFRIPVSGIILRSLAGNNSASLSSIRTGYEEYFRLLLWCYLQYLDVVGCGTSGTLHPVSAGIGCSSLTLDLRSRGAVRHNQEHGNKNSTSC